jgi:hypothetical protein
VSAAKRAAETTAAAAAALLTLPAAASRAQVLRRGAAVRRGQQLLRRILRRDQPHLHPDLRWRARGAGLRLRRPQRGVSPLPAALSLLRPPPRRRPTLPPRRPEQPDVRRWLPLLPGVRRGRVRRRRGAAGPLLHDRRPPPLPPHLPAALAARHVRHLRLRRLRQLVTGGAAAASSATGRAGCSRAAGCASAAASADPRLDRRPSPALPALRSGACVHCCAALY